MVTRQNDSDCTVLLAATLEGSHGVSPDWSNVDRCNYGYARPSGEDVEINVIFGFHMIQDLSRTKVDNVFQFNRATISFFGALCAGLILSTAASAAAPQTSGPEVTYASGPEVQAMFIKHGRINYPWIARRQYRSGSGIYRVYVNPDGKVRTVGVVRSTGHKDLDLAAAAGLYHSLFKPGRRRELDLPVTFTLTRLRRTSSVTDVRRPILF